MILIIDNYDSFTYNLAQYLGEMNPDLLVKRNNQIKIRDIKKIKPSHIIISPGPKTPNQAGISLEIIKKINIPILGVCLGHQCIAQVFGANITKAPYPMHGKTSNIHHDNKTIFKNIKNPFTATRYHSLIINPTTLPKELEVSATTDNLIMGIRHKTLPLEGIQFHPESFLTEEGKTILSNFIDHYK